MSGSLHAMARLVLPCDGPEIKGSVSYITPTSITWRVEVYGDVGSEPHAFVTAQIDGNGRNGERAVGSAYFGHRDNLPNWVERPNVWIALVTRLLVATYGVEVDQ